MHINKTLAIAGIATTVALTGVAGVSAATAATDTSSGSTSLVDKLVAKFKLNKSDVQAVFDEEKTARDAERQQEMSDRLQDAVDDGDITAEQKTLIENKQKELQTAREAEQTELEAWATENDIDAKYLMGGRGGSDDDRLQDAVDDGDLTAEQKTLIETKQDELKEKRDTARDALEQWAEDNDINQKYLMGGGHGGFGGPGDMGGPGGPR